MEAPREPPSPQSNVRCRNQRPADNHHRRMDRKPYLLAPRPYEAIYHERAYLASYLEQKTQRIERLIREYSEAEAQLERGATGKTRRRLRKLLSLLRGKLDEASEQERAMFSRMGELYMELSSRESWERAAASSRRNPGPAAASSSSSSGEGHAASPSTPCPSFASSDWSVSSGAGSLERPPESPLAPVPEAPEYEYHDDTHSMPVYLDPDKLDSLPGEEDCSKTTPPDQHETAAEHELFQDTATNGPEIGTLEYNYVDCASDDEAPESDDDGTSTVVLESRTNRWSVPTMRFNWPDA